MDLWVRQLSRLSALADQGHLDSVREIGEYFCCYGVYAETASQYWEFTPRGANFAYLEPYRRQHPDTLFGWLKRV